MSLQSGPLPLTSDAWQEGKRKISTVLFDIDDTFTTDGAMTAEAFTSLARLTKAGYRAVPITGRPAGWCDHIARMWPVDGVVGENGAFYFFLERETGKLTRRFIKTFDERVCDRARLHDIAAEIIEAFPGTALASDQPYRESDIAIDYREDVQPLPLEVAHQIKNRMESLGLTAKVSSIHVNGWLGAFDKLTTTREFCREFWGINIDKRKDEFIFIGDSPNDQPMFEYFPMAVGVANIFDYGDLISTPPKFATRERSGLGFAEVVNHLIGTDSASIVRLQGR